MDDAFFSNRTFCDGIRKYGFHLVSRFRDDAHLCYLYEGGRTGKRGRPKIIDGKINYSHLDKKRMKLLNIDGLLGKAYTLPTYSKALKCRIRLVIWVMPGGRYKLFFSTDTALTGEEVLDFYRTRFQIEFCYRDSKNFTGLMDCQAGAVRAASPASAKAQPVISSSAASSHAAIRFMFISVDSFFL